MEGDEAMQERSMLMEAVKVGPSALMTAVLVLGGTGLARGQEDAAAWVRQATVTFEGTVVRLGARTTPEGTAAAAAVVRVEEVLQAAPVLGALASTEITVLLDEPGVAPGERALFFTQGSLLGDGIIVRALGLVKGDKRAAAKKHAREAQARTDDDALRGRLTGADVVVAGRVTAVEALPQEAGRTSEHDPEWHDAVLSVSAVLKGDPSLKQVWFRFPASVDVAWFRVPKARVGQEGAWALRVDRDSGAYTALDARDVQPPDQVQRLRGLVGREQ
jgi:hypothetical protein